MLDTCHSLCFGLFAVNRWAINIVSPVGTLVRLATWDLVLSLGTWDLGPRNLPVFQNLNLIPNLHDPARFIRDEILTKQDLVSASLLFCAVFGERL